MDRLFQGEICRMRKTAGKGILFTVSESKLALIASRREFGCEPLHVTDKIKRLKNRPHGLNIMQKTSPTPVQPKPALEKAIKLCPSGYGADAHSAPVKTSSGQLIALIRYPFCRNIPFIIHLQ
ncbi:hypothetical protein GY446_002334 [Salmonella enterica subsp. houtenae]|nr:hypothetical protein [Salmonella enterica subsp. houtenae]